MERFIEAMLKAATQITTPLGLGAFVVVAVLALVWISRSRRAGQRQTAPWIVLVLALFIPTAAGLIERFIPEPFYHLHVTVVDSANKIVMAPEVSISANNIKKSVDSGWEFDISPTDVPPDGKLTIRAYTSADGMSGSKDVFLTSSRVVNATVVLFPPPEVRIRGIVSDTSGRPLPLARVRVEGYPQEAIVTGESGSFDLNTHVPKDHPVLLHTELRGFSVDNQTYTAAGDTPVMITLKRRLH